MEPQRLMTDEETQLFEMLDSWYGRLHPYNRAATASFLFNQLIPYIRAEYVPKNQPHPSVSKKWWQR